ncbi:MAG: Crp/Fnr family transcriptional regulator [Spirochaetota bacterium]
MTVSYSSCNQCELKSKSNFKCLNQSALANVDSTKKHAKYHKGDYLFRKGEPVKGFFCMNMGSVRTFIAAEAKRKEYSFAILFPGDWAGWRDTILDEVYSHSAVCLEDSNACFVAKETILHLMQENFTFQRELLFQMAREWQRSEKQAYSLGTKQIHSKLAELLITFFHVSDKVPAIELKVTREVMASMIGTTTESVIRALADFKVREWISLEKNKIVVFDYDSLFALSKINEKEVLV